MIALLLTALAWADCPAPTTSSEILDHTESALLSFVEMDEEGFVATAGEARQALGCLEDVLVPEQAAAFHRLRALLAFTTGDRDAALRDFRAAVRVQPDHTLRSAIAPPGGPLASLYAEAQALAAASDLPLPEVQGTLYVDGQRADAIPEGHPSILQVVASSGQVGWTGLVTTPADLPEAWLAVPQAQGDDAAPEPTPAPAPLVQAPPPAPTPVSALQTTPPLGSTPRARHPASKPLLLGAAAGAVVAAGLYGGAAAMRMQYDNDPRSGTRNAVNGLYFGAIGTAAAGGLLGATALTLPHVDP